MNTSTDTSLDKLADEIFQTLAKFFPVCLSSDEFHFFPQIQARHHDWAKWDDFSKNAIKEIIHKLSLWETMLTNWNTGSEITSETAIDICMLIRIIFTIKEQLDLVRTHETQPTLYLTIAGIGLAEALEKGQHAWQSRLKTLPDFFDHAKTNLTSIPDLFQYSGFEMIEKFRTWLLSLEFARSDIVLVLKALERFEQHLERTAI